MTSPNPYTAPVVTSPAARRQRSLRGTVQMLVPYAALIVLFLLFTVLKGQTFIAPSNLLVVLQQSVVLAIVAYGMTFVITSGSIDLSVGSVVGLSGVVTALVGFEHGALGLVVGAAVGALAGLINGVVFAFARIPSFIVTLGMLQVARGLTILISGGSSKPMPTEGLLPWLGVMPGIIIAGIVITLIAGFLFQFTVFGRRVRAIGGNERVAALAGVPTRQVKVWVFVLSGLLAGIGGSILAARLGTGSPIAGQSFELDVIAAVVIGGTPLTGGLGRISGTVVGALIISMLSNGLVLIGVGDAEQTIVKGIVLAIAVFISLDRSKIGIIK
ncbi:ABC transporter permease [Leucobacter luti]|uniref:Ribose transport system permease protein/putative xylitol transport system permease protein n=1 Tax=Leucobacter luti TaxID=340320 RepID=A0A4Q7U3R5_9MICO|nr:ABC transporter permease [Leucobacter luti]MBL3700777.1 ABC transporter permease [Leucobacter luti]RZT68386.1 ribose transport system permease protein/putative xylitol transport system permease protein [Leucobacter luti]